MHTPFLTRPPSSQLPPTPLKAKLFVYVSVSLCCSWQSPGEGMSVEFVSGTGQVSVDTYA